MKEDRMKIALVYQGGIANVFLVEAFDADPAVRAARRVIQLDFRTCEWYCRGARLAGAEVRVYSVNAAGDVVDAPWTEGTDDCPLRDNTAEL
jgi:hypothetical protein